MALNRITRMRNLMTRGHPRWTRIYDNNGDSMDRYTVVFTGKYRKPDEDIVFLSMSAEPFSALGVCLKGTSSLPIDVNEYGFSPRIGAVIDLGKRITFDDLPPDCRRATIQQYIELWKLPEKETWAYVEKKAQERLRDLIRTLR
jgi:hypothetical protein